MTATIRAWKKVDGGLTSTDVDDLLATSFDVHYPGAYCGMPMSFDSKNQAERVAGALSVAFAAGGRAKLAELRAFLEIK